MKQKYAALADLVGQLLAARWIQDHEQNLCDAELGAERPTNRSTVPPSQNQDNKEDA